MDYAAAAGWGLYRRTGDRAVNGPWRVGNHYGIHVYEGDRPVATFHDPADAERAVQVVNVAGAEPRNRRDLIRDVVMDGFEPVNHLRCTRCGAMGNADSGWPETHSQLHQQEVGR